MISRHVESHNSRFRFLLGKARFEQEIEDMMCAPFTFILASRIAPAPENLVLDKFSHEIERSINDRCVILEILGKHLEQRLGIGDG